VIIVAKSSCIKLNEAKQRDANYRFNHFWVYVQV